MVSHRTIDEVNEADVLLINHAHFDHVPGADKISKKTGAKVIGNGEAIRGKSSLRQRYAGLSDLSCVNAQSCETRECQRSNSVKLLAANASMLLKESSSGLCQAFIA